MKPRPARGCRDGDLDEESTSKISEAFFFCLAALRSPEDEITEGFEASEEGDCCEAAEKEKDDEKPDEKPEDSDDAKAEIAPSWACADNVFFSVATRSSTARRSDSVMIRDVESSLIYNLGRSMTMPSIVYRMVCSVFF
jgi:hypothetical protein